MRNHSDKGFTILELIVAISMASILISIVYFTWNYMEKHISVQKRKAELSFEINWVSQQILSQIKRSNVLSWDDNDIVLETEKDSIRYSFNTELLKNGNPFKLVYKGISLTGFHIEEVNKNNLEDNYTLLKMNISAKNVFNDTAGTSMIFEIKRPNGRDLQQNDKWNF